MFLLFSGRYTVCCVMGERLLRRSCVATSPLNVTTVARSPAQAFSKNSTDATLEENENVSTAQAAGKRALPPVPMQRTAMNGGGGPQKSVLERLEELTKVFMDTGVVGYCCREPSAVFCDAVVSASLL